MTIVVFDALGNGVEAIEVKRDHYPALEVAPRWLAEGAQASAPIASADPCPTRTVAVTIALEGGASPAAVARVLALPPDGRPALAWIVAILEAQKK